ncbi:MAG: AmmeMemoRadiSam system radical SAM enzyme [archaeon]|nr:AmmeMemoRadiSam system radical SAM enzyme [archaeon]
MAFINPNLEGSHYHSEGEDVVCDLCPHHCRISPDHFGVCKSRKNHGGKLVAYNYGRVSTMAVDPIEKKPLYHYHPGTSIFSLGSIGCNMHCEYCQNYSISMSPIGKKRTTYKSPSDIVAFCRQQDYRQIAFTYNEPAIWYEYICDIMEVDPELDIVLVSNGMISEDPLNRLCKGISAANVDIKSFDEEFYRKICGGRLDSVLSACETIYENKVHLELTYLVIPGHNDDPELVRHFVRWAKDHLDPGVPIHFTRFHPDYKMMDLRLTPVDTLLKLKSVAEDEGMRYVYVGNVMTEDGSNTYCPECGQLLIRRMGFKVDLVGLEGNRCSLCKHRTNIIV